MLKYATIIAPLLLRLGSQKKVRDIRGEIGVILLFGLAITFFLAALFTWVARTYGLDLAFLTIGVIFCIMAIGLTMKARISNRNALEADSERDAELTGMVAAKADPLSEYIPEDLLMHPFVQKVLAQIEERPFVASFIALVLGIILSNQIIDTPD